MWTCKDSCDIETSKKECVCPARVTVPCHLLRLPVALAARTTAPRLFAAFLLLLWVAPLRPLPAHFFFYHGPWPSHSSCCCTKLLFSSCSGISPTKRALMDHATEVASHEGPAFSDHEMSQREDFSAHHVFPTVFSLYAESRSHRPYHLL